MAGTPLHCFRDLFRNGRVVLASGSPRRKQLLEQIGIKFDVVESEFPENLDKTHFATPADYAVENARRKGLGALLQMGFATPTQAEDLPTNTIELIANRSDVLPAWLVIACDTVVVAEAAGESEAKPAIFEKPVDEADALSMLRRMNGRSHQVVSGVWLALIMQARVSSSDLLSGTNTVKKLSYRQSSFHETTQVKFSVLSDAVMKGYVSSGEGFGKAGGYGIQGLGASLIERIDGDFYNVMGFPLNRFCRELAEMLAKNGYNKTITG